MLPTQERYAGRKGAGQPSSRASPTTINSIFYFLMGCLCSMMLMSTVYVGMTGGPDLRAHIRRRPHEPDHFASTNQLQATTIVAEDTRRATLASIDALDDGGGPWAGGVFNPYYLHPSVRSRPVVVITPTYERTDQAQVLMILGQQLAKVPPPVVWLVVEDPSHVTKHDNTVRVVRGLDLPNAWVLRPTPKCDLEKAKLGSCNNTGGHRGLQQRNLALFFARERLFQYREDLGFGGCVSEELQAFLKKGERAEDGDPNVGVGEVVLGPKCEERSKPKVPALVTPREGDPAWVSDPVVYLADDDNVYDLDLFDLIRNVKRVGVMPVGFLYFGPVGAEAPVVENRTHIVGWRSLWCAGRRYPMDMAGVAFSLSMLDKSRKVDRPEALKGRAGLPVRMLTKSKLGHLESDFLEQMIESEAELELIAGAELVLVYHMKSLEHREQYFKRALPLFVTRTIKQPVERTCSKLPDGTYWGP